jgi:hypothetical protein
VVGLEGGFGRVVCFEVFFIFGVGSRVGLWRGEAEDAMGWCSC